MDARMNHAEDAQRAGDAGARALARVLIACVVPMLNGPTYQAVPALLNAILLLAPACDLRRLQALTHYRLGQYVEAMRCWEEIDDMSARALGTLCLRAIGEPSWWGAAQVIYESGDADAIAILEPWMNETPAARDAAGPGACAVDPTVVAAHPPYASSFFRPLRA
ncbi:hypothetical protein GN316_15615 [Xylophilus sp. Kf1]|nr:hypothetical protein [Xylophilus sp. Kf1]